MHNYNINNKIKQTFFFFNVIKDSVTQYRLCWSPSDSTVSLSQQLLSLRAVIAMRRLHLLRQMINLLLDLQYHLCNAGTVFSGALERISVKDSKIHPLIRIQQANLANLISPTVKVLIIVQGSGRV